MKYLNVPVETTCPLCAGRNNHLLYTVDSEAAAQHFVLREVMQDIHAELCRKIEALWGGKSCRIVRCRDCMLTFADPFVAGDGEFYRLAYPESHYPQWRWEFDLTLERLRALVGSGALSKPRILEVGAGNGALSRRLIDGVTDANNLVCTEYSAAGGERIVGLGVTCIAADFRDRRFDEYLGGFDAVVLSQVLEHLDNLNAVVDRLVRFLKNDGYLFVSVPGEDMIEFYEENDGLLNMPPNHISNWTETAFRRLAERSGLRLIEHRRQDFVPATDASTYAKYLYLRKAQQSGSLANRIEAAMPRGLARTACRLAATAGYSVMGAGRLAELLRRRPGKTQWALLQKDAAVAALTASAA